MIAFHFYNLSWRIIFNNMNPFAKVRVLDVG